MKSEKIVQISAKALDDKKCKDLQILKVEDLTALTEYFVIATASSNTHVRALSDEVEERLKANGVEPKHIEGKSSGWVILDYLSVIVNVFTPDKREFYNLDKLWENAEKIDLTNILNNSKGE